MNDWKKYVFLGLAGLLGLAVLAGLVLGGAWLVHDMQFKTFADRRNGVEIKYPKSWELKSVDQPGAIVAFVSPKETALDVLQENMNLTVSELPSAMPLEQFAELIKKQMLAVFKNLTVELAQPVGIAGRKGYRFVFRSDPKDGSPSLVLEIHAFVQRNKAYNLTYLGTAERHPKDKWIIWKAASSLKTRF